MKRGYDFGFFYIKAIEGIRLVREVYGYSYKKNYNSLQNNNKPVLLTTASR